MTRLKVIEELVGDTIRVTWRSPGVPVTGLISTLMSGSETLVQSVAAVDSGGGYYYALHQLPSTPNWYVNRWTGFVSPNTYSKAQYVKAISPEVD